MSDPENPTQPLINHQAAPSGGATPLSATSPPSGRSSRAWKVAGLTLLAGVLIVGQVTITYFLLSQNGDIKDLEKQNNDLKVELRKGSSVSVPMRMHMPMNAMSVLDTSDEESSTGVSAPALSTKCQLEAAGVIRLKLPGFRPSCDERGFYKAKQCFKGHCWCVNPINGEDAANTSLGGDVQCGTMVFTGNMNKLALDVAA